ncbi:hypothetical protein KFE25_002535 [Diacronema lutheri]|uniref:Peptidase U32 collagenase domain-containing protein n=2 Tax=Diacronema lutheri TaxID=2081491 RepID=A0A8J6C961_DIALT|nr:hypothetical protein KFE25_002535 [Diacronema lutheri]
MALAGAQAAAPPPEWQRARAVRARKHQQLYRELADTEGVDEGAAAPLAVPARSKPHVLAPAGGWPQLRAAIAAGADAVYFGCSAGLNARARASNFGLDELGEVMATLNEHGVRGYMCVNVLTFDEELDARVPHDLILAAHAAGVHALIVQDLAVAQLARELAPGLGVHASTQMSVTDGHGAVHAAREARAETVVVGRELSVDEVGSVRSALDGAGLADVGLEVFVHGALCVSYSGQCFSSEAWGGRSANRGQCAQACRMPYGLLVDGRLSGFMDESELEGGAAYLLSPQDLGALELVPQLIAAGAATLKIEGRLKGAEYVYATTRAYRAAVDTAWAQQQGDAHVAPPATGGADGEATADASAERAVTLDDWTPSRAELAQLFARAQDESHDGLSSGFLRGPAHQQLVRGRTPGHRGVFVGTVSHGRDTRTREGGGRAAVAAIDGSGSGGDGDGGGGAVPREGLSATIVLEQPLAMGDGIVFDDPRHYEGGHGRVGKGGGELGGSVLAVHDVRTGALVPPELQRPGAAYNVVLQAPRAPPQRAGARAAPALRAGQRVWRTKQLSLERAVSQRLARAHELGREAVRVAVRGASGQPLVVELVDSAGRRAQASTVSPLAPSTRAPPSGPPSVGAPDALAAAAAKAIGDLGASPLALRDAVDTSDLAPGLHVPGREIKAARRAALSQLVEMRAAGSARPAQPPPHAVATPPPPRAARRAHASAADGARPRPADSGDAAGGVRLSVLCRTAAQVEALSALPSVLARGSAVDEIICDHLEMRGIEASVALARAAGLRAIVAAPRVIKPAEDGLWRVLAAAGADGVLVRSAGLLAQLADAREASAEGDALRTLALHGDFSLNAANAPSARLLLGSGLARLTPTHDCNGAQAAEMARRLGEDSARLELIVHTHLPIFHTEHCVFARTLSVGNSYVDCGHPCERHAVHLRSAEGDDHLLLADMGCRNTLFNAQAQSGARFVRAWRAAGVRRLRIELVDEPAHVAIRLVELYAQLVRDEASADDVLAFVDAHAHDSNGRLHGVGEGSLRVQREREWSSLKKTARR